MKQIYSLRFSAAPFVVYIVMLMATELVQLNLLRWWDPLIGTLFNLSFYSALAWVICLVAAMAGRWLGRWADGLVHGITHTAVAFYSVSSLFIYMVFGRHWDAYTMQFVRETNWRETSEFLTTYLSDWHTLMLISGLTLVIIAEITAWRRLPKLPLVSQAKWTKILLAGWLALMGGNVVFFGGDADRNYDLAAQWCSPIKRNAMWNMWQSELKFEEFKAEFEWCAEKQQSYDEHPTCKESSADVVFVIGESFCRHMSNLYDGHYDTNPLLLARKLAADANSTGTSHERMYVFTDAIATDNGTTQNFKYFMSTASVAAKGEHWYNRPLFPTILRRAGYNITFYSNQFAPNDNLGQWDASMGFVNHPGIEPYIFDHRNRQKFAYDLELVADYAMHRKELERSHRNLCIFHLYGQHVNFSQRFPASFCRFKASDVSKHYQMRPHSTDTLDFGQRRDVADYLNATAYNDIVVDSIIRLFEHRNAIVVYFSDHGEEVHNFRRQYGRTDLRHDSHDAMRCQLDVPLMVYLTPTYARLHADVVHRLSVATNRRLTTDNLSHLLFDLLGISSKYFHSERSVASDKYREPRRRLLQNGRMYN